jgi:hypothetical protein
MKKFIKLDIGTEFKIFGYLYKQTLKLILVILLVIFWYFIGDAEGTVIYTEKNGID